MTSSTKRVQFKLLLCVLDWELCNTPFPSKLYNERLAERNELVRYIKSIPKDKPTIDEDQDMADQE